MTVKHERYGIKKEKQDKAAHSYYVYFNVFWKLQSTQIKEKTEIRGTVIRCKGMTSQLFVYQEWQLTISEIKKN